MKFLTNILILLTVFTITSCDRDPPMRERQFLDYCSCNEPFVESIEQDTCVFDPVMYPNWALINGNRYVQKLAPGEKLVVFYPLDPDSSRTWQNTDTLVREAMVSNPATGWNQEIMTHSKFRRADHYRYSNQLDHPEVPGLYDFDPGRIFTDVLGDNYSWMYMSRFYIDGGYQTDPPPGTRVGWAGWMRRHYAADTIVGGVSLVGHWYQPENSTDTTYGFIGWDNTNIYSWATPPDSTHTYCRVKYFDPPPRLQNDEW